MNKWISILLGLMVSQVAQGSNGSELGILQSFANESFNSSDSLGAGTLCTLEAKDGPEKFVLYVVEFEGREARLILDEILLGGRREHFDVRTEIPSGITGPVYRVESKAFNVTQFYFNNEAQGHFSDLELVGQCQAGQDLKRIGGAPYRNAGYTCMAFWTGYVFNQASGKCERVGASACSNPFEFTSSESCEAARSI